MNCSMLNDTIMGSCRLIEYASGSLLNAVSVILFVIAAVIIIWIIGKGTCM